MVGDELLVEGPQTLAQRGIGPESGLFLSLQAADHARALKERQRTETARRKRWRRQTRTRRSRRAGSRSRAPTCCCTTTMARPSTREPAVHTWNVYSGDHLQGGSPSDWEGMAGYHQGDVVVGLLTAEPRPWDPDRLQERRTARGNGAECEG